jgi:hypothetical protein
MLTQVFFSDVVILLLSSVNARRAKELLVLFSVILGFFLITVLERFDPFIRDTLSRQPKLSFGCDSLSSSHWCSLETNPQAPQDCESGRFMRDKLQDVLLASLLAFNGT